ncbi:MAG TPA: asparagine synthase (glutamine-hydrolyzing) [Gemmatimonadales bacterium]|jgi:asparagine synthase (glutamine-hydrolysing)|nr:asparagine synthase (glutamine-hydrolyzing) [Gemmatimonadales bacterium]
MCGIVAIYDPNGGVQPDSLARATARLHHRGPDAQRQWIAPHGRVGLGHARLSIIDLVTGDQPIANEDGQRRLIVNGELYDFDRIRRELELGGHRFRTGSDSEIALHLYEDLGPRCLQRLRGEYALVLWDEARQELFAARDRFGIKPLFFAWHRGALYLASEVKALFAAGVPARWSRQGLFDAAVMAIPPTGTLFEGVSQVPPGHYLVAGPTGMQLCRYWDFSYPETESLAAARTDADWTEELHATLDEAVRLRLRADVPVGCYLSGGLDSCSVIGLAARHLSTPIRAFTLAFEDAAYDEAPIAREMAARANAEFHPIPIRQVDLAEHFADAAWNAEALFINAHGVAKYVLSRAVRDAGYKVVLTGEGSDEILAGYPHFRRDMLLYDSAGQDPAVVRALLAELEQNNAVSRGMLLPDGDSAPLDAVRNALGFVPSWIEAAGGRLFKLQGLWSDDTQVALGARVAFGEMMNELPIRDRLAGRAPVNQALYLWAKTVLPNYILTVLGDRMEMAHSVEGRVPFLDHEVVELISRMPVHLKIRGMTEKYVLREAARPVLTDTVYRRQKHPFLSPPATLNPHDRLHQMVQDTLRGSGLDHLPFVDRAKVVGLLDGLGALEPGEQVSIDQILMILLSGCVLGERLGLAT